MHPYDLHNYSTRYMLYITILPPFCVLVSFTLPFNRFRLLLASFICFLQKHSYLSRTLNPCVPDIYCLPTLYWLLPIFKLDSSCSISHFSYLWSTHTCNTCNSAFRHIFFAFLKGFNCTLGFTYYVCLPTPPYTSCQL